jgi:uncharacterized membrane protein
MNIPIHARVDCADGEGGETVAVIVHPGTAQVTHFVVAQKGSWPRMQRLVPVDQVVEVTSDLVTLQCTREELGEMESFIETQYIKGEVMMPGSGYAGEYMLPYAYATAEADIPVEVERIPLGELAIHRGTRVEATDGQVGKVDELLLDPTDHAVTHFIMSTGHMWGKRDVTVPLSAIDHTGRHEDIVWLKLDKEAVGRLPAVPATRKYRDVELIARVFDTPDGASSGLEFIQDLHRQQRIKVRSAAVVIKDADGEVSIKETADLDVRGGRLVGAITGGLVGLLGGPVGMVIGALAGLGVGGAAAKRIDVGLPDKFLEEVQEHLQPNSSALIMLVQAHWKHTVGEELSGLTGVVLQQTISDEVVARLMGDEEAQE